MNTSANLPHPHDVFTALQDAAPAGLKTWMNDRYGWLTTTAVRARIEALGLEPDAGDPAYLREFALAVRDRSALTYQELTSAFIHAGITSEATRKALARELHDPRARGSELYAVDAVAKWVQEHRKKSRASAKARKESGAPVRSTKLVAAALQWAKTSDDGRYPSLASLVSDAEDFRRNYDRDKNARFDYQRKRAKQHLETAKGYEDLIVQRYTAHRERP